MKAVADRTDAGLVLGGTAARFDPTARELSGRAAETEAIDAALRDPAGPRVLLVRGELGAGRTEFVRAAADRRRAAGIAALPPLDCVPGDGERPLLLALRLVRALEEHHARAAGRRASHKPAVTAAALSAVRRGDPAAMAEALATALARPTPATVIVDDVQHADAVSLALLDDADLRRVPPGTRLLLTAAGPFGRAAHTITLPPLTPEDTACAVARRLGAMPDAGLVRRVHELSRGVPGAVDVLLAAWVEEGAIRLVDRYAFLVTGAPVPVVPDGDRYVAALRALGEPCWTVVSALSVLWPLGRSAAASAAATTGLSAETVTDAIDTLTTAGVLDELPAPAGPAPRGWTFRMPLTEHAVRERLGPMERGRLSAAAVEHLWTAVPAAAPLPEADAATYLPDRIADAGVLVDRERAVTELTSAAVSLYPDLERRGMVRWHLGAVRLIDRPPERAPAVLRCGQAAFGSGDYRTARAAGEWLVGGPAEGLDPMTLHEIATLLVASASVEGDWPALARMSTARWWEELGMPAVPTVSGRIQALCLLERWQEALDLLTRTEAVWRSTPGSSALLDLYGRAAEFVLGRPERFTRALALPEEPGLPRDKAFAHNIAQFDLLLGIGDLRQAEALLATRGLVPELLPLPSQFLWHHLHGRWDEALVLARRLLVNGAASPVVPGHQLLPARTAAVLRARGRVASAERLIASARGPADGPLHHVLDHAEAEVLRTLGDRDRAEEILRRGLRAADERGSVYGTEELWASLAELHAEAGRTAQAMSCLRRLSRLATRTHTERARLLHLLTSARVLGPDSPDTRAHLHEAIDLARSRRQPFETAITLTAAATAHAAPAALLHEAYDLFAETGATLRRFHTRSAIRESGLTVPGRKQAMAENEHLLATLLAEGLGNRQIGDVLRLSEDAVANRLSRLFARTGMRSRTAVVTAVLKGGPLVPDFPAFSDRRADRNDPMQPPMPPSAS